MPLKCTHRGSSSVDDAFKNLDESLVQFVIAKFPVGSGTFKRNKFVYLHFVGSSCGAVKRGKWNQELPNALKAFRNPSAGFEVSEKESLTFDSVVTRLQKVFVADDGSFSLAKVKEEYDKRLEEEKKLMTKDTEEDEDEEGFENATEEPGSPVRARKTATQLGLTAEQVLKAVHEDLSPFNWATFDPNPKEAKLAEAGSNGVFELLDNLPEDGVKFGLVRMAFGTGRFRRSKCVFFQWVGDKVGAVTKGKCNAMNGDMLKLLGPANAKITLHGSEEKSLEAILGKVEKVFVVDNIKLPSGETKKPVSHEAYVEALLEEQKQAASFYGEPEDMETPNSPMSSKTKRAKKDAPTDFPIEETVDLIYKEEGGLTWAVLQAA